MASHQPYEKHPVGRWTKINGIWAVRLTAEPNIVKFGPKKGKINGSAVIFKPQPTWKDVGDVIS